MLVEFRVKNFRSLRDEQVLSLVASKDRVFQGAHTIPTGIHAAPALLRSAVLYGANASGKSNLIKALQYMRGVVTESATVIQPGQTFAVQPFRLDVDSVDQPSEFEVTFLLDSVRYQYGFAMTAQRIVSEHLLVYKAFKPQRWFVRHFDAETGKDIYEFGSGLKGAKNLWEGATRPNSLFLSMAVQLNSEALLLVFNWFSTQLLIFNEQTPLNLQASINLLKDADKRKEICRFLTSADISITGIDVESRKVLGSTFYLDPVAGKAEVRTEEKNEDTLRFHHVTDRGSAVLNWMDESSGTRDLLFLIGPILDLLKKGVILVIDELGAHLHTLLVRELVRLFHSVEINTSGAQLIFTTHDVSLLNADNLFRRDQVWLIEKDNNQASTLVGLSEFSPRQNEALEKGYLTGRYGGIPFLNESLGLSH